VLYREINAVCSHIHTKHTNTLCGQNENLLMLNLAVRLVLTVLSKLKSPTALMRVLSAKELMFARHANRTARADLKR
jgi:hypothetical protein